MEHLVAFFDILGTQELVKQDRFSAFDILDFINPVGVAARFNPEFRFAAFSDSVVISADDSHIDRFVAVLCFLVSSWFADFVFARGGVALGEVSWVDQPSIDRSFRLPNFQYCRIYGKALVEARELERASGPGAICFLSEVAAHQLDAASRSYVLPGLTPMLAWPDKREALHLQRTFSEMLKKEASPLTRRHLRATSRFFDEVIRAETLVPDGFRDRAIEQSAQE